MRVLTPAILASAAFLLTIPANSASLLNCGSGPLDIKNCPAGPQGPQGEKGDTGDQGPQGEQGVAGPQGDKGDTGATGEAGTQGLAGIDGKNGKDGINGRDGRDFDSADTLALSAALSPPVWLGDNERVRISTGVGFTEGAAAVGATGVVRIDGALAGFAGAAVSTETGAWAGKAGISVGF